MITYPPKGNQGVFIRPYFSQPNARKRDLGKVALAGCYGIHGASISIFLFNVMYSRSLRNVTYQVQLVESGTFSQRLGNRRMPTQ